MIIRNVNTFVIEYEYHISEIFKGERFHIKATEEHFYGQFGPQGGIRSACHKNPFWESPNNNLENFVMSPGGMNAGL